MGKVFNMVGGGGAGSPDLPIGSRINVTSDIGATITINRGSESHSSVVPASGTVTFTVNQSGTWQLSASKTGEEILTDTVSVLADDTDYNVDMRFWDGSLYDAGNEYTAITGGWEVRAWKAISGNTAQTPTFTKNADNMNIYATPSGFSSGVMQPVNDVDVSNFSALKFNYSASSPSGVTEYLIASVVSRTATYFETNADATTRIDVKGSTSGTGTIDISSISGLKDIAIGYRMNHNSGTNISITVTKIWLE